MATPADIPFNQLLDALLDESTPLNPRYLYRLTDLTPDEAASLRAIWPRISTWRRQALLEDIEVIGESDFLLSFEALSRLALEDADAKVRAAAVRTLWDIEEEDLVPLYLDMLHHDENQDVRAAAATALSKYVYLGEIEELETQLQVDIENSLLMVANSADVPLVRRRVLEALGFSSREEVIPLIEAAYETSERDWVASALFAMGRSANERWIEKVIPMLNHPIPAIRLEAARAAGELEAEDAVETLLQLLEDDNDEVRLAAVWSLSQIGGEGVREALENLQASTEDDEEADLIDEALDNLTFTEDMGLYSMFDIPTDDTEGADGEEEEDLFQLLDEEETGAEDEDGEEEE